MEKAKSYVEKVFSGLLKTRENLAVMDELILFWNVVVTDRVLDELEEALLVSYFGPKITARIVERLRDDIMSGKLKSGSAIKEILLVLDGNTGLNMLPQAREFNENLDGSARGGCVVTGSWRLLQATPMFAPGIEIETVADELDKQRRHYSMACKKKPGVIALFDVDDTLTAPRKEATQEMLCFIRELRKVVTIGLVGGSDLSNISEQLGKTVTNDFDYCFTENGLVAHKGGKSIGIQSMKVFLGEDKLKELINFTLHCIADLDIPIKRGTFIEFRNGMINVSPIGRNCSQEERDEFERYDKVQNIRSKMVAELRERFPHLNLTFSIGGQISFDVFPKGWDKTYCLQYLEDFNEIHFFGDKTYEGGNDYEIYESPKTIGHRVTSPDDTMAQCKALFMS